MQPVGETPLLSWREGGTVFGLYHMTVGLAALPGALLFGGVWQVWGSAAAFFLAAGIAAGSMLLLTRTIRGA